MQTPQLHAPSEARAVNRFLSRKAVSSHAGKCKLASSQPCPCSKPSVPQVRPHRRQQNVVLAAAATATAPRSKTSSKKRKQVEPLLVVEDISKSHDGQRFLFDGLSFTVSRGDRLALVGPNGAGKSSLFNLLSGMPAEPCTTMKLGVLQHRLHHPVTQSFNQCCLRKCRCRRA